MPLPIDALDSPDLDLEPTSEVRTIDGRVRRLVVATGLRRRAAEQAWVTVSDEAGVIHFEGTPSADGCVEVSTNPGPVTPPFEPLIAQNEPDSQATS